MSDGERRLTQAESIEDIACALRGSLCSENESDRNFEVANVVDGLFAISRSIGRLAKAVESASAAAIK